MIRSKDGSPDELPFCDKGILVNSGEFDGLTSLEAIQAVVNKLSPTNQGSLKINYRLRDWLVSRQRYWGHPNPDHPLPDLWCRASPGGPAAGPSAL